MINKVIVNTDKIRFIVPPISAIVLFCFAVCFLYELNYVKGCAFREFNV